jgi:CubicO group peptidase (beta-lactamase class C family)
MASGGPGLTDATVPEDLSGRIAEVLKPYFDQQRIPGISVAIVKGGQVALAQGYGQSNVATGAPVEADTEFNIGSVTKTFTALGVLLLYQESQGTSHALDLNAPISEYLKNTRFFKLPRKWSRVTTMELLDMTSGIGNGPGALPWQAQVNSIAKAPLLFAPGKKTFYSDTNYDLLGELIEQRTGETYGTFIEDQILEPLSMRETQVLGQSPTVANQAVGYDSPSHGKWPRAKLQNGLAMYAAAGMVSTARDMASYMAGLLSGRLLDPATYSLMWNSTPTPQYGVNTLSNSVRGLGWDTAIHTSAGPILVSKGGSVPGFISEIILSPAWNSGVFVSINTNPYGSRQPSRVTALQVAESVYAVTQTASVTGG